MEVDLTEARQTFETNFFAVIAICQKFAPLLIKAKGTIVQIGSVTAVRCLPWSILFEINRTDSFAGVSLRVWVGLQRIKSSTSRLQ